MTVTVISGVTLDGVVQAPGLLAEDQHPVGDLRPGREHEPFRMAVKQIMP